MTDVHINNDAMVDFLIGLLNTPSPTGYAERAIDYVQQAFMGLNFEGLETEITHKGALRVKVPGAASQARRGLTAHVDTLGLMVKEIKSDGRLKTTQLGGYMWTAVEFEGCTIRTFSGQEYRGTVLPHNPSVHVNYDIRDAKRTADMMEVRLDARVESADDTRALGIEVGDYIFLDPRVEVTDTGFIRSRHLDDKASVATIYGALLALRDEGLKPAQDTFILITNYEEVGHGGASGMPESLTELIAVDMAAIGTGQSSNEYSVTVCVKDASGPYHHELSSRLRRLATANNIDCQVDIYPYYGSDGSAYWRAGGAAKVALVGPGVDASHGYERTHVDSLYHTAHLLARYLLVP